MESARARLRLEAKILGLGVFALPLIVAGVFTGVSLLADFDVSRSGGSPAAAHADLARGLLSLVEFGLPPVAGFATAAVAGHDPARELHFALPATYPRTIFRRLALFSGWAMVVALGTSCGIALAGDWLPPRPAARSRRSQAA